MDLFACETGLGALPELRSYRCFCCGYVGTDAGAIPRLQRGETEGARFEQREAPSVDPDWSVKGQDVLLATLRTAIRGFA
jgi:hypothetical protein